MSLALAITALLGGVISYLLLPVVRSTASHGQPASALTPLAGWSCVAGGSVAASLAVMLAPGSTWVKAASALFATVGVVLAVIDVRTMRLPDVLTLPLAPLMVGLVVADGAVSGQWERFATASWCALAVAGLFGLLWVVYPGGMGLGDVKLAPSVGFVAGLFGAGACAAGLFVAFVIAAVVGVVAKVRAGRAAGPVKVPFGPFLILGPLCAATIGEPLWVAYGTFAGLT